MIPSTQSAVQLVGADQLTLTPNKVVPTPGATQFLAKVECVGLCQSDMKLLHQFNGHVRKSHAAVPAFRDLPHRGGENPCAGGCARCVGAAGTGHRRSLSIEFQ